MLPRSGRRGPADAAPLSGPRWIRTAPVARILDARPGTDPLRWRSRSRNSWAGSLAVRSKRGMTETPKVNLNQVERGIEEALRKFTGGGTSSNGGVTEITAGERIDNIGHFSALAIEEASATTAKD